MRFVQNGYFVYKYDEEYQKSMQILRGARSEQLKPFEKKIIELGKSFQEVVTVFNSITTWTGTALNIGCYRILDFKQDANGAKSIFRTRTVVCQPCDRPSAFYFAQKDVDCKQPSYKRYGWINMVWEEGENAQSPVPYLANFFYNDHDQFKLATNQDRREDVMLSGPVPANVPDLVMTVLILVARHMKCPALVLSDDSSVIETGYKFDYDIFKEPYANYYNKRGFIKRRDFGKTTDDGFSVEVGFLPNDRLLSVDEAVLAGNDELIQNKTKTEKVCKDNHMCKLVSDYYQTGTTKTQQIVLVKKMKPLYANAKNKGPAQIMTMALFFDQTFCVVFDRSRKKFAKARFCVDSTIADDRLILTKIKQTSSVPQFLCFGAVSDFIRGDDLTLPSADFL